MIESEKANGTTEANAELSEVELNSVAGGSTAEAQPVKVVPPSQPTTQDKAFAIYDAYVRG
jgi:hypothetical protein